MFKAVAVVPVVVVVIMTLSIFWLPPQSGEKLLINGLACVLICIFLVYLSHLLPLFAASSPLIGKKSVPQDDHNWRHVVSDSDRMGFVCELSHANQKISQFSENLNLKILRYEIFAIWEIWDLKVFWKIVFKILRILKFEKSEIGFFVTFSHCQLLIKVNFSFLFSHSTVTFYSHTLYLLSISFIISVIVINLSRNRCNTGVPKGLKSFFIDGFLGSLLGGKQADFIDNHAEELKETPSDSDDHHIIHVTATAKAHAAQNEWIRLAIVIDRLAFVIYAIAFILMGILHFV